MEALIERLEVCAGRRGEYAGAAQALVGRLGPIVDPLHAGPVPVLGHELLDRLKEVDVEPREPIDAPELCIGRLRGEAIIADELPHDGAVLLLDVGAVVLLPGAAASKGDAPLPAVVVQAVVDELTAVVAIEAEERHGQALPHPMHGPADALVALTPDRVEFDPGGGDVDGAEGAEVEALRTTAAVGDEIDFEKAGPGVVPLGKRAEGNLMAEPGPQASRGGATRRPGGPGGSEQPPEGGGTDVPNQLIDLGRQRQLAVAGEPVEQFRHEGMEPLGADLS